MDSDRVGTPPYRASGAPAAVAVLLWVFLGWPASWALLFLAPPVGVLFGVAITVAMLLVVTGTGRPRPVAMPVAVPTPRQWSIRRDVEGLAHIDAAGGCGWCGSASAHVNDAGYPVHPRHWHAGEIEERIRERSVITPRSPGRAPARRDLAGS